MFLGHISQVCHKHRKVAFTIIGFAIIFPFVFLWGVPGGAGRKAGSFQDQDLGTMYGKKIDSEDFFKNLYAEEIRIFLRTGRMVSEDSRWKSFWVKSSLRRVRAIKEAKKLKLDMVSDEEVLENIKKQRIFQKDKKFDLETFKRFKKYYLLPKKISGGDFDRIIKENIIVERLEASVRDGIIVSDKEVRDAFNRENKKFSISYRQITRDEPLRSITITEKDAKDYFSNNKEEFKLPLQKKVKVAVIKTSDFQKGIVISDKEAKSYFLKNRKQYDTRRVNVSQVFIKNNKKIQKKLDKISAEIDKKTPFATIVKTYSDDLSTKLKGGDLGWVVRGKLPKKVENIALATVKGKITPPIKTAKGYYILKINNKSGSRKSFKLVKNQVKNRLSMQKAKRKAKKKANIFAKTLKKTKDKTLTIFESLAKQQKIELKETPAFSSNDYIPSFGRELARKAYSVTKIKPFSELIVSGNDFYIACFIDEISPHIPDFDEYGVKAKVMQKLQRDKSLTLVSQKEIEDYYKENKVEYRVPIRKTVLVGVFKQSDFVDKKLVPTKDEIKSYYDSNLKDYDKREVKASHIMIKSDPKDTDKDKLEKKKKLEKIKKQLANGKDFAELAKKESEGPSSTRGGDLGWFKKGQMVPAFDKKVFSMKKGEISDIVETRFGYHIIKLFDTKGKKGTLEESKKDIILKVQLEKADKKAEETASLFSIKAYKLIDSAAKTENPAKLFAELAKKEGISVKTTEPFKQNDSVKGFSYSFSKDAFIVTKDNQISDVIKGTKEYYIACFKSQLPAYIPYLGEENISLKIRNKLKREKTMSLAKKEAQKILDKLTKEIKTGKKFDALAKIQKFKTLPAFSQQDNPSGLADAQKVKAGLKNSPAESFLPLMEGYNGVTIVYLNKIANPEDKEFEKVKDSYPKTYLDKIKQEALDSLYKRLEKESETKLTKAWQ